MRNYPASLVPVNHVEPVPRRVRGFVAGEVVFDTIGARYVWEWPAYPQYYVPLVDIRDGVLAPEDREAGGALGPVHLHGLRVRDIHRPSVARLLTDPPDDALKDTVRFEWAALDAWFEEDEQVFVHPRSPYSRVDALRSTRTVRVELDGILLAESSSPVLVFETGLPTRYYLNRTDVEWSHLEPSDTVTECPYKGLTAGYWSARVGEALHEDLAWSYDFPTRQLLPIAGLVAFYNERVDIAVDGRRLERPRTHFSRLAAE